jgi:hypothetical protein
VADITSRATVSLKFPGVFGRYSDEVLYNIVFFDHAHGKNILIIPFE